jgi:hypothetical protein
VFGSILVQIWLKFPVFGSILVQIPRIKKTATDIISASNTTVTCSDISLASEINLR